NLADRIGMGVYECIEIGGSPFSANVVAHIISRRCQSSPFFVVIKSPNPFGFPESKKESCCHDGNRATRNVYQVAVYMVRPEILCECERGSHDQDRGKHFERLAPPDHGAHQSEGYEDGRKWKNPANHRIEIGFR